MGAAAACQPRLFTIPALFIASSALCCSKELQKREAAKQKQELRRLRLAPTW